MQSLPAGWEEAKKNFVGWETKITVSGVEYRENSIVSVATTGSIFQKGSASIGGCVSREIDLKFLPREKVPRMAEIRVYVRPVYKTELEWMPKGVFFIDTRTTDNSTGEMTIHGYDAMLKAEAVYMHEGDTGQWPRPCNEVVADIANRMGVTMDSRTVLDQSIMVDYPNDYTMRELLGYIAVAHAGNWIISDRGELLLVSFAGIQPETNYLVDENGNAITLGGVRLLV